MRTKLATTIVVCLLAVGVASTADAQHFELTRFGGWRFGGGFESLDTGADLDLDGTFSYGLIFSIPWKAEHRSRLEVVWSAQNTTLASPMYGEPAFDLDVHYLHLSGMVPFHTSIAKLDTLLTAGAGVTYMPPGIDGAGSESALGQLRRRPDLPRFQPGRPPVRRARVVHLHRERRRGLLLRRLCGRLRRQRFRPDRRDRRAPAGVLILLADVSSATREAVSLAYRRPWSRVISEPPTEGTHLRRRP